MKRASLDATARTRRDIVRRGMFYSVGFVVAALVVALLGAAGVAWLLRGRGLPFLKTWLIVSAIIVLPGLIAAVWQVIRKR